MNNREILAANIRSLMKQRDIKTQAQLANATRISQTQISNILCQRKSASVDILERLADGLECERWLLLAPITFLEEVEHMDFEALVYCYMRLDLNGQEDVWKLAHQRYEDKNVGYPWKR